MAWKQDERGYWIWEREEKKSSTWSSGRLIDTTSYYTSSYYNSKHNKWSWNDTELTEEETAKQILITKAYKAARDMVVVLDLPFRVKLLVESCSGFGAGLRGDERRICVSTAVFDKSGKDDTYKVNVFCGAAIHEACHLKYTALRVITKFSGSVSSLCRGLADFIEDLRIEENLTEERPGYTDFITLLNEYEYERIKFLDESLHPKIKLFNNILRYIKYQSYVDPEVIAENQEFFDGLSKKLKNLKTTKDSCGLGKEIYEYLNLAVPADEYVLDNFMKENFGKAAYGIDADSGEQALVRCSEAFEGSGGHIFRDTLYGAAERGDSYSTIFQYLQGTKRSYEYIKSQVKQYIPGIRKLLLNIEKNYDFNIYGCRSGALDTNKLAEAYQNVPQVYVRQGHVSTNRVSVCVLVDESGSMSCEDYCSGRERYVLAREAAILLNEGFKNIPGVGLYIYGHTADIYNDGDTILYIYREPGNNRVDEESLCKIQARQENRDGTAILEVAKRVRKLTKDHILFIILSDGYPCACNYHGYDAWEDVRASVKYAEQNDMDLVQVNIGEVQLDEVERTFSHHIDLEDISALPNELSKIIKKLVVGNKESTISM